MRTLKVHYILATIVGMVLLPVQILTTLVGGCLVVLTFGLLILLLTLIWWMLIGPMLLLSLLWLEVERLRFFALVNTLRFMVSIIGLPTAIIAASYVQLTPSGDPLHRLHRINMCAVWPYSWDHLRAGVRSGFWERSDHRTVRRRAALELAWRTIRIGNPYPYVG